MVLTNMEDCNKRCFFARWQFVERSDFVKPREERQVSARVIIISYRQPGLNR